MKWTKSLRVDKKRTSFPPHYSTLKQVTPLKQDDLYFKYYTTNQIIYTTQLKQKEKPKLKKFVIKNKSQFTYNRHQSMSNKNTG